MYSEYIRPFPRVIRIEPAGACNLACSHCPTGTIKMPRGLMNSDTFATIIDSLKKNINSVKAVVLYHGGEPLLNKSFTQMVKAVKSLGIPLVKTVSNGMLLNQTTIDDIIDSKLDVIEISLDGDRPETNNLVRRNSDYNKVVANIKTLINRKIERNSETPQFFVSSTQFLKNLADLNDDIPPTPPIYYLNFQVNMQAQ